YDRVIVLQVHENGHSTVLAEDRSDHVQPLQDMEFSPVFMSRSFMQYYGRISYSYLPVIDAAPQYLISEEGVVGYTSVLTFPPDLHTIYCTSIGVIPAAFCPLFFNGKFWGLLIGHHYSLKE